MTNESSGLQLTSLVKKNRELEISLVRVPVAEPAPDEVVVRVEAAPINPSDLFLMFGPVDMTTAKSSGDLHNPVVTATIPESVMRALAARVDESMPVGNEGAGVVVKAGSSPQAQALLGKTVAVLGGAMYSQFRTLHVAQCLELPPGTKPSEGASCFVNPLTSLGMVETMRREGHTALVHTAAASNLGQMLNRICIKDGVKLVNIVRRREQEDLLRSQGARYVCNSTSPNFTDELTQALIETGATLAFDAIGGGKLVNQILSCMEAAAVSKMKEYNRYGSTTYKQVYIYGFLDRSPTELTRNFGFAWGVGGWLLMPFMEKIGREGVQKLRARVVAELKTTFASHYTKEISLREAMQLDIMAAYAKFGTGEKYLINPAK
ncbi:MAG TPA: zinc-binding dehydrogenase [Steroidobacter sp.]|jgi:NADPH2:quinone reductase|nr:zinc-binding dehydrogenase [Steroidobacter sp.]